MTGQAAFHPLNGHHRFVCRAAIALGLLGGFVGCGKNPGKDSPSARRGRGEQGAARNGKPASPGTGRPNLEFDRPSDISLSGPQDLHPMSFAVGQVGQLANDGEAYSLRINRIVDGTSMVVTLGRFANWRFLMKGFSTAGKTEGEYVSFSEMVKVGGTARYGGSTIHVLEPLSAEDNAGLDKQKTARAEAARQEEKKRREAADAMARLEAEAAARREMQERRAKEEAKRESIKNIPRLVAGLADKAARPDAILSLGKIGEPAVPALLMGLEAEDEEARRAAAMVLGHIGPAAKGALPSLRRMADKDIEDRVREAAAKAIERITRKK